MKLNSDKNISRSGTFTYVSVTQVWSQVVRPHWAEEHAPGCKSTHCFLCQGSLANKKTSAEQHVQGEWDWGAAAAAAVAWAGEVKKVRQCAQEKQDQRAKVEAGRALTVIICTQAPAQELSQVFQMHGSAMGTFTKNLVYARHWTGHLNLHANVINLEDMCASSN